MTDFRNRLASASSEERRADATQRRRDEIHGAGTVGRRKRRRPHRCSTGSGRPCTRCSRALPHQSLGPVSSQERRPLEAPPPIRTARPDIPVSLEHFLARAMGASPSAGINGIEAFAEDLFNLTASIIETQTKEAGAREAPCVEARARRIASSGGRGGPGIAPRVAGRAGSMAGDGPDAQMSGATVAVARVANSDSAHAIAGKATGAAAGASQNGRRRDENRRPWSGGRQPQGCGRGDRRITASWRPQRGRSRAQSEPRHERCRSQ